MSDPPIPAEVDEVTSDLPAYARVPRALVEDPDVSHLAVRVFAALTRYERMRLGVVPSLATIGNAVGVSRATAKRAVRELVARGAVTVEQRWIQPGDDSDEDAKPRQTSHRFVLRYTLDPRVTDDPTPRVTGGPTPGSPVTPYERQTLGETDVEGNPSTSPAVADDQQTDDPYAAWPDEIRGLCREFAELVSANGHPLPSRGSQAGVGWLREMDRLLRLGPPGDGGVVPDADEVRRVMRWALEASDFWPAQIRSVPKFREQFSRLRLQARQRSNGRARGPDLARGYAEAARLMREGGGREA